MNGPNANATNGTHAAHDTHVMPPPSEAIRKAKYAAVTHAAQTSLGRYQEFDSLHGNLLIPSLPQPSVGRG